MYQLLMAGMKYCTETSSCRTNRCTIWSLAMSETPQTTQTVIVIQLEFTENHSMLFPLQVLWKTASSVHGCS